MDANYLKYPLRCKAIDLRLADVVLCERIHAYHTATVSRIDLAEKGTITLFRPYVSTADFSMGNSVICYIGIEEWAFAPHEGELFTVLERKTLK